MLGARYVDVCCVLVRALLSWLDEVFLLIGLLETSSVLDQNEVRRLHSSFAAAIATTTKRWIHCSLEDELSW